MELVTVSIADRVFSEIESSILCGHYKIGDIITETKLSEEYGVSRTPIREAVRRLEQEKLVKHVESERFEGTAFDIGTAKLYEQLYYKLTEGREMTVTPEMAAAVISVIETVHAQNPLPLKY